MMNLRNVVRGVAAMSAGVVLLAACTASRAKLPIQSYIPVSRSVEPWGEMQLSDTRLHLAAFDGDMVLEYAGTMTESAGKDLAGASIFRIKNADKFYKKNKDRESFCVQPARWVAVNSTTGAHAWSTEISVSLLMNSDWTQYSPRLPGLCAGGKYVRAEN